MILYKTHPHNSNQVLIVNLDKMTFMRKYDIPDSAGYTAIAFSDGNTIHLPSDDFDKITKILHWRLWEEETE